MSPATAPATLQIGLIASPHQTSGSDRYYFDLVRALGAAGARVAGVVLGDPTTVEDAPPNLHGFASEGSGALRRWSGLRRTLRPLVPASDVVVAHLAAHVFPALDVVRDRPLVEHFHGPWALEGRFARLPARTIALRFVQERTVYARARRIVVLSHSFGEVLQREYGVDGDKIRVVPGGVDLARFSPRETKREARERLDLPHDRPVVATVRRLESTKGVDVLIEAAVTVCAAVPETLFVVAGTGSLAGALAALVAERGLERNVRFAGKIGDAELATLYRAADCTVVPSQAWEGFGLVCLESLASGTPVFVTPVGGMPEAVTGLDPGLVCEDAGAAAIAASLVDALRGRTRVPDEAACLGYAAGFAWPAIAARVAEVYREAV